MLIIGVFIGLWVVLFAAFIWLFTARKRRIMQVL